MVNIAPGIPRVGVCAECAQPKGMVRYVSPVYVNGAGRMGRKDDMDRASKAGESRFPREQSRTRERFARSVLDGLSAHIAVLDGSGVIVAVNEAWRGFARANGADPGKVSEGANYLEACDAAAGQSSEGAAAFAAGVRDVLRGRWGSFELVYPCHSREVRRWFVGRVTRLPEEEGAPPRAVVAHEDVTDRRLYEEERERRRVREAAARARALEQKRIGRELCGSCRPTLAGPPQPHRRGGLQHKAKGHT